MTGFSISLSSGLPAATGARAALFSVAAERCYNYYLLTVVNAQIEGHYLNNQFNSLWLLMENKRWFSPPSSRLYLKTPAF